MNLITQTISLPDRYSVPESAEEARNSLALMAQGVQSITTPGENEMARLVAVSIRTHLKEVESARVELTKPLLDGQRLLKALADDHIKPLKDELMRLERLATVFLEAEQSRVAAEMKARLELAAEAKTDADFAIISNEPLPEINRARGQTMKQVMKITVTDIVALAKARPELVRMEPNLSAINALCVPDMPNLPPGLLLSWENKAVFTSR